MTAAPVLDPQRTALVLVDLMDRIVALPLEPRKGTEVLATAEELAAAFRAAGALVVLIRVERPAVAEQPPGSGLAAGLPRDGDLEIVKRTIGGFQGTGLDERLRERGIRTLLFGGIATNLGVESTARAAADLGYDLVFVEDAMAAFTAAEHDASVRLDFPRLGTVVTAAQVRLEPR
ncbi:MULTISPECIES: isochorismatase family protein [unclassified Streptomyces]|uniref:isochorismatase family protein n=1 Tax=unclassified Streptomyces TaxID=2593676 RepID=UPI0011ACBB8B|nr:isochorismatase family protein [Streptomyces sp. BK340]TVZ81818.1 nicotinamidase-related amidase [Streptomyces sp. BK340]